MNLLIVGILVLTNQYFKFQEMGIGRFFAFLALLSSSDIFEPKNTMKDIPNSHLGC